MKIRQIPLFLATALMAAACDDDNVHDIIDNNIPADQKEAIAFSMSETGGARFGQSGTRAGFTAKTQIVARFESFKSLTVGAATPAADAEKRTTRTVLEASAEEQASDESWYSPVVYKSDPSDNETDHIYKYKRFWDDSFSRLANISVYAVAVPQVSDPKNNNKTLEELVNYGGDNATKSNTVWKKDVEGNTSNNNIAWTVTTGTRTATTISGQTADLIAKEDLCYSNNIQADGENGRYVYDFTTESYPAYSGIANKHEDGPLRIALKNTTDKTSQGHFDKGHLIFRHALTRLTVYLKKGAGFAADAPFAFEKVGETNLDTNVKIYNVPVSNTLNIQTGVWQDNPTRGNIELMGGATAKDGFQHALMAQFVPGYVFTEGQTDTKVLEFTIDESTYYVSSAMIYTALATTENAGEVETIDSKKAIKMKQGKNYVLEITVNKTGINNVTAELVDWETIKSTEIIPSNKYVNVVLEERGSAEHITTYDSDDINKFDIYRKASTSSLYENTADYNTFADYQWLTPYESAKATKEWDATNSCWKTGWFWPDNKTYYHLRVVGNDGATAANQTPSVVTAAAGDYFSITSGALSASDYRDYLWGAPFTDINATDKFVYTVENGFDQQTKDADEKVTSSQICKAIGATGDRINLMLFHMTSQIFFEVKTTTGNDKVELRTGAGTTDDPYQQTQVELLRFYKDGTVLMGTGKVDVSGDLQSAQAIELKEHVVGNTTTGAKSTFQYGVVPQTLDRHTEGDDSNDYKIGIRITTPDGNQYVIQDISTVYATVSNNHLQNPYTETTGSGADLKYKIDRWYPGYKYTYSVTLKKTGIEKLTAQLVEWEEVSGVIKNGDNEEINLEGTD